MEPDHPTKPDKPRVVDVFDDAQDQAPDPYPEPLTPAQAAHWRSRHVQISPWKVLACQLVAALVGALLVWLVTQHSVAIISWLYGAAAIALPAAAYAALVVSQPSLGALVFGELGKLLVSVVLMALAPWLLGEVVWSMLLLAIVLTVNMYWIAPIWLARSRNV